MTVASTKNWSTRNLHALQQKPLTTAGAQQKHYVHKTAYTTNTVPSRSDELLFAQVPSRPTASNLNASFLGSSTSVAPCGNCGWSGHISKDPNCPARGKQCNNCGKMGHVGCCCRGQTTKQKGGQGKMSKQKQVSRKKACAAEKAGDTSEGIFGTIQLD